MKILHITHTHVKTDSRILKEITSLAEAGFDVSAIGSNADKSKNADVAAIDVDVTDISIWTNTLKLKPKFLKHILCVIELLIKIVPLSIRLKPNVIHVHDTVVLPAGIVVKMLTGAKLIYDAHELESDRNGLNVFTKSVIRRFEILVWKYVDGLIVVSPSIKSWYIKNIGYKNTEVIYNSPIYDNRKAIKKNYLRERFSISPESKIFIYVGILEKGRGIDIVLESFKRSSNNIHVVFMGYGLYYNDLERVSAEMKNIHVHPAVAHSEVVEIISSADFGLCIIENISLSDYYSLPNKLYEYFFANIPVLASNFPDITAFVTNHKCGITCNVEIESISNSISLIEKGSETFEFLNPETVDWNSQKEKLLSFYKTIFFET